MSLWHPDPPQGFDTEQELIIAGRPLVVRYDPPQRLVGEFIPPTVNSWIDNFGNQFIDNFGNVVVFSP